MSWWLSYDKTQHLIQYVFEGSILSSEVDLAMKAGAKLCHEHDCYDILIDSSGQESLDSIMVLYQHAGAGYAKEGIEQRRTYIAVVLPKSPQMIADYQFYETVCHNRGWSVQTFDDPKTAIQWLKSDKTSNKTDSGDD